MTATIKRIATRWTLPALMLIAGGFACDGLTEVGHHAFSSQAVLRSASELEGRDDNVCARDESAPSVDALPFTSNGGARFDT
jgi:hypothetical protein